MTKKEIYIKHLNKRVEVESSKEIDYNHYLAILDAMEEYAQQERITYIVECPYCGEDWNIDADKSCSCGAYIGKH